MQEPRCFSKLPLREMLQWGNVMNGTGKSTILNVKLSTADANQLMRWERLDGIGPARYGELEQLSNAIIKGH